MTWTRDTLSNSDSLEQELRKKLMNYLILLKFNHIELSRSKNSSPNAMKNSITILKCNNAKIQLNLDKIPKECKIGSKVFQVTTELDLLAANVEVYIDLWHKLVRSFIKDFSIFKANLHLGLIFYKFKIKKLRMNFLCVRDTLVQINSSLYGEIYIEDSYLIATDSKLKFLFNNRPSIECQSINFNMIQKINENNLDISVNFSEKLLIILENISSNMKIYHQMTKTMNLIDRMSFNLTMQLNGVNFQNEDFELNLNNVFIKLKNQLFDKTKNMAMILMEYLKIYDMTKNIEISCERVVVESKDSADDTRTQLITCPVRFGLFKEELPKLPNAISKNSFNSKQSCDSYLYTYVVNEQISESNFDSISIQERKNGNFNYCYITWLDEEFNFY